MRNVLTSFSKLKGNDLLAEALGITKAMSNNENFKSPIPSIKKVHVQTEAFKQSLERLQDNPAKSDYLDKSEAQTELGSLLNRLAKYVNLTANGELSVLRSSGMKLAKDYKTIGVLDAPDFIHVNEASRVGEVNIYVSKVQKAKGYSISYKKDSEDIFQTTLLTSTKGRVINLQSGEKYTFKATAISSASSKTNEYNFSSEVSRFIQ